MRQYLRRDIMLYDLFLISVGLVVGWNVLPQPTWVRNLYIAAKNKITSAFDNDG